MQAKEVAVRTVGLARTNPNPRIVKVSPVAAVELYRLGVLRGVSLFAMHLYLVGYRGCGKSTIGKLLASKLQLPFWDSDEEVEKKEGVSIREIFQRHGETGFRDREVAALDRLSQGSAAVLSLGGGAILRPKNRQTILRTGRAVWLRATPQEHEKRIHGDATTAERRPNLTGRGGYDEIVAMLTIREPLYREVAQKTVETDQRTPDEIAEEIALWFAASKD